MMKLEFDVEIIKGYGGGMGFYVPFDATQVFGKKGRVFVRGTIEGIPYRNSIAPMGGGSHVMGVTKEFRKIIGKTAGDMIHVVMEPDNEQRIVTVPQDIIDAIELFPEIKEFFENLSYTHKKEIVQFVDAAKKIETRMRRIEKIISRLFEMKSNKKEIK